MRLRNARRLRCLPRQNWSIQRFSGLLQAEPRPQDKTIWPESSKMPAEEWKNSKDNRAWPTRRKSFTKHLLRATILIAEPAGLKMRFKKKKEMIMTYQQSCRARAKPLTGHQRIVQSKKRKKVSSNCQTMITRPSPRHRYNRLRATYNAAKLWCSRLIKAPKR